MRPSLPYLATQFKLTEQVFPLTNGGYTQVLGANPNRYAIIFCSVTGGQINLARNPNIGPQGSITLANAANASIQDLILTWDDVAALVTDAWFAQSKGPADTLGVNEIMYVPTA